MTIGSSDGDDNDLVSGFTDPRLIHGYLESPACGGSGCISIRGRNGCVWILIATAVVAAALTVALVIYSAH